MDYNKLLDNLSLALRWFGAVVIIAELIYLLIQNHKSFLKETFVNLCCGLFAVLMQIVTKSYVIFYLHLNIFNNYRLFNIGIHWYTFIIGFFLYAFIHYTIHYLDHKIRFFWCIHEVHHSAMHMNATTGLRTSIFEIISLDFLFLIMPLLGIHPIIFLLIYTLSKFWGTILHVNENILNKIPIIENILTTPSNHHIHHAKNPQYIDKNFGEIVPWFDMLFKTYVKEIEHPIYGTNYVSKELTFWESQTHEFKRLFCDMKKSKSFFNKLKYLIKSPSWQQT